MWTYESELVHHGVKGMKWGVRHYQNPDGSWKSAGNKRRTDDGVKPGAKARPSGGSGGGSKKKDISGNPKAKKAVKTNTKNDKIKKDYRFAEDQYNKRKNEIWNKYGIKDGKPNQQNAKNFEKAVMEMQNDKKLQKLSNDLIKVSDKLYYKSGRYGGSSKKKDISGNPKAKKAVKTNTKMPSKQKVNRAVKANKKIEDKMYKDMKTVTNDLYKKHNIKTKKDHNGQVLIDWDRTKNKDYNKFINEYTNKMREIENDKKYKKRNKYWKTINKTEL